MTLRDLLRKLDLEMLPHLKTKCNLNPYLPYLSGKLKYVRIFYDTPSFDKIRKDRAAKFVDKFSSIGGTMGLLTGFSVISGVEIIYFLCKIVFNIISKKRVSDEE